MTLSKSSKAASSNQPLPVAATPSGRLAYTPKVRQASPPGLRSAEAVVGSRGSPSGDNGEATLGTRQINAIDPRRNP